MKQKNIIYKLVTLLMCSILAFGNPCTVLAETEEVVESEMPDPSEPSESVSEPAPSQEESSAPSEDVPSEPVSEPASEPASELESGAAVEEPVSDIVIVPDAAPTEPVQEVLPEESLPVSEPEQESAPEESATSEPVVSYEPAVSEESALSEESAILDNANNEESDVSASDNTPALGSAPATTYVNGQKITANVTDAEKFLEDGYDANLCWAATASNMIWTSGYGAESTNPLTGALFQNEDEVFDYFRKCFTDDPGDPSDAINYFITGTYPAQGITGASQKKKNAPAGKVVSGFDSIPNNGLKDYDQSNYNISILEAVGNITGKAVGTWIRFWNSDQNAFYTSAHWATLYDVVKDTANNIIGVLLVDSDNDTVVKENYTSEQKEEFYARTDEAKANNARIQPNTYTYYELESISAADSGITKTYSVLKNYVNGVKSLIGALTILEIIPLCGGPDPDDIDDDTNNTNNINTNNTNNMNTNDTNVKQEEKTTTITEDQVEHKESAVVIPNQPEQPAVITLDSVDPVAEALFDSIKDMMIKNNIDVYSPAGTIYDKSSGTGYDMIIRRLYTTLANVYVNGKRIPNNGKYYKIVKLPNGLFTITFTDEYLKLLGDGEHSIKMDFVGSEDLNTTVTVK